MSLFTAPYVYNPKDLNDQWGTVNKRKPLDKWVWKNVNGHKIPLGKMTRSHVRSCVFWCIKCGGDNPHLLSKDGRTYQEWISAFTTKMFDPKCI